MGNARAANLEITSRGRKTSSAIIDADFPKEGIFTGAYCINPMTGEEVPIWLGNYVVSDYGSGAVMAVPAHDERDCEFAKANNLPIKVVVAPIG